MASCPNSCTRTISSESGIVIWRASITEPRVAEILRVRALGRARPFSTYSSHSFPFSGSFVSIISLCNNILVFYCLFRSPRRYQCYFQVRTTSPLFWTRVRQRSDFNWSSYSPRQRATFCSIREGEESLFEVKNKRSLGVFSRSHVKYN